MAACLRSSLLRRDSNRAWSLASWAETRVHALWEATVAAGVWLMRERGLHKGREQTPVGHPRHRHAAQLLPTHCPHALFQLGSLHHSAPELTTMRLFSRPPAPSGPGSQARRHQRGSCQRAACRVRASYAGTSRDFGTSESPKVRRGTHVSSRTALLGHATNNRPCCVGEPEAARGPAEPAKRAEPVSEGPAGRADGLRLIVPPCRHAHAQACQVSQPTRTVQRVTCNEGRRKSRGQRSGAGTFPAP
jgi:hypothetical protein